MPDIIHLLPDSVANQIAAGEVIQRPASVIKELVENSLDAGATKIDIITIDAGKTCIQVVDNGSGMSETDARLAFERHATSKIKDASDLFALHTMGFRGEALASIAAVAQVELKTRKHGDEIGVSLSLSGSRIISQQPETCDVGANFAIKNLFFNVPARRKFLKSDQTELNNIISEFERIVLAHPEVHFTLQHNGTTIYELPQCSSLQRISDVFGKKMNQQLFRVGVDTSIIHVKGFIGTPESARKKGLHQFFFVNGRFMRHPYFHRAIMAAYERLIPVGEQISYFVYLDIDPAKIDVNIHPTKTEIKFEDEQAIFQILMAATKESLGKYNAVPTIDFNTASMPDIPVFNPDQKVAPPKVSLEKDYDPFSTSDYPRKPRIDKDWEKLYENITKKGETAVEASLYDNKSDAEANDAGNTDDNLGHYQYKKKYIITSVRSGLMLVDQHRAHIRILYDRYREQLAERNGKSQRIMFPELIQLSAQQRVTLANIADEIVSAGFDISDMGDGSFALNGVPAGTETLNATELLRDVLSEVENHTKVKEEVDDKIALTLANKAAIRQDVELSEQEMRNIVDDLFACKLPNYTPDGKIIVTIIPQKKIDSMFG